MLGRKGDSLIVLFAHRIGQAILASVLSEHPDNPRRAGDELRLFFSQSALVGARHVARIA